MKFGIFSDVHGNLEALTAALAFFREQPIDEYLCLGDTVGYGANPEECVALVRALPGCAVVGNHDYILARQLPLIDFRDAAGEALRWTADRLSAESRAWLESLPLTQVRLPFRLVHAGPSAPDRWRYVETRWDAESEFDSFAEPVCLIGHRHVPLVVCLTERGTREIRTPEWEIRSGECRYLVNAGSVGQPRDGDPRLCVVVYDDDCRRMTRHRLDYDIAGAQEKIRRAGLPEVLARRLELGR